MDTLIHSFLPNSSHIIEFDQGVSIHTCFLRPFGTSFVLKGTNISYTSNQCMNASSIQLWYKSMSALFQTILYTIHSNISIDSIQCTIGGIKIHLHGVSIKFSSEELITIHIQKITIGTMCIIKRFHSEQDDNSIVIQMNQDSSIHIQIPEVRILSWIPFSIIQNIRKDISRILPPDDSNSNMPTIHISSIFIRYMKWHRCISPISIGGSYKNIWELWEHVMRAVTRI